MKQQMLIMLWVSAAMLVVGIFSPEATAQTPVAIDSIEALQRIGNDDAYPLNGYYVLTRDIDARHTARWNNGAGFAPIGQRLDENDSLSFTGWFDGQGHVIHGLVIQRPEENGVGLFGSIGRNGVVVNIGIEDGVITGGNYVGPLVGENWSHDVGGCYASAEVNGISRVGGLAGINRGTIELSSAYGNVVGDVFVGGLVGRNYDGVVEECVASGEVFGLRHVGSLIGETARGAVLNAPEQHSYRY